MNWGDSPERPSAIQRALVMHGTSWPRERSARLLSRILVESGAWGIAYGVVDEGEPGALVPIYSLTSRRGVLWDAQLPDAVTRLAVDEGNNSFALMIRGAEPGHVRRLDPLVDFTIDLLVKRGVRDRPTLPRFDDDAPYGAFLRTLDAFRCAGFAFGRVPRTASVRHELLRTLPGLGSPASLAVAADLADADRLDHALITFAGELEDMGADVEAAGIFMIAYELALIHLDAPAGLEAARSAGRAFRRAARWRDSLRWYGLARRIAESEGDFRSLVRVLDGIGNTYRERGSFPKARIYYRDAWKMAQLARDPAEMATVALGLMTVEREAGQLEASAVHAWTALSLQRDPTERANLLLNIGTLLREGRDIEGAQRAYRVCLILAKSHELRVMALDALAYCAALTGDVGAYAELRPRSRGMPPYLRAQIGYFRGASLHALGDPRASRVLRAVERFARSHGLAEWEIKAVRLGEQPSTVTMRAMLTPVAVSRGLRELESSLAS